MFHQHALITVRRLNKPVGLFQVLEQAGRNQHQPITLGTNLNMALIPPDRVNLPPRQ